MTNPMETEFIDSLKSQDLKVTDELLGETQEIKTGEPKPEKDEEDSPRNRRERRFVADMEKIRTEAQKDREARIAAEERMKALMELDSRSRSSDDPDETKFYGDTPEGKFARAFLNKKFEETKEEAKAAALEEIRKEQESQRREQEKDSESIDLGLSQVEDEFDVDLSGRTPESKKLRNGYIDFLQELTTDSFPDFVKSFEVYRQLSERKANPTSQRQKALADRSMAGQGSSAVPQERKFKSGQEYIDYLKSINGYNY